MAERPEDLNLPTSVVSRIIKEALPEGVAVSKDARLAISKAASVFVLYATSCANNFAMQSKRKTISGPDVVEAMSEMEFEKFVEPLKACLEAYKKELKGKKEAAEKKRKEKEQDTSKEGEEMADDSGNVEAEGEQEEDADDDDAVEIIEDDEGADEGEEEAEGE